MNKHTIVMETIPTTNQPTILTNPIPFTLSPSLAAVLPTTNGTLKTFVIITRDGDGLHLHDSNEDPIKTLQTKLDQEVFDNGQLQNKLLEAKDTVIKKNQEILVLQEEYEKLSAKVGLDKETQKNISWLKKTLFRLDPNKIITEDSTQVKDLISLEDKEFETLNKTVSTVACMRYAVRKRQTKEEGQKLFVTLKSREPVGSELNSFAREIRVGEFLVNLTVAYNKDSSILDLISILGGSTSLVEDLKELEAMPFWIMSKFKPATVDGYIKKEFLTKKGVAVALKDILSSLKEPPTDSKSKKRTIPTSGSSSSQKKSRSN